jgi:hypothetical protein
VISTIKLIEKDISLVIFSLSSLVKFTWESNLSQEIKSIIQTSKEILNHENERDSFGEKYKNDKTLYDIPLTEKEIKNAKKDKVLLKAWTNTATVNKGNYDITVKNKTEIYATPKKNFTMPIYSNNSNGQKKYPYMWLIK